MSHSLAGRQCLRHIRQRGNLAANSYIQTSFQARPNATSAIEPSTERPFRIRKIKRLVEPGSRNAPTPIGAPINAETSRKRTEFTSKNIDTWSPKNGGERKKKYEFTSGNADTWISELVKERKRRYLEYGYLRHRMTKKELKDFENWKNDCKRLYGFASFGEGYKVPKVLSWIQDRQAVEDAIEQWPTWTEEQKKTKWRKLMFSALWSCPDRATAILEITTRDIKPPGYAISDAIHFLAKWQSQLSKPEFTEQRTHLCNVVVTVFERLPAAYIPLRQNTIYMLTHEVELPTLIALYDCWREKDVRLHSNTLQNMARRLAVSPLHKNLALQMAIDSIPDQGVDLDSGLWASLCTSILSLKRGQIKVDDGFSAADAFVTLIEHGFAPNMVHYTAVIRSLCLTDQNEVAEEVFRVMQRHNFEPDMIMWSTLLDGGKRALSPSSIESAVIGAVEGNEIDVPFFNDLLMCLLHFCKWTPGVMPAFGPMLHFYSKVFHLAPLQALLPVDLSMYLEGQEGLQMPADWELARQLFPALDRAMSTVHEKMEPTSATLSIMFLAYVRSMSQPINLISLYAYLRQEILKGSPGATKLVQEKGSFMYDVLIKALCKHPGMLRAALDIVGDMLKYTLEERSRAADAAKQSSKGRSGSRRTEVKETEIQQTGAQDRQAQESKVPQSEIKESEVAPAPLHPAPSVFTWSILLHGFSKEKGSGERILAQMRQHGVEPNLVTWNTLIAGYARAQDVNKTVLSLQRLEASGHEADDFTLRAFSRLVNRELALRKMEDALTRRATRDEMKRLEEQRMAELPLGPEAKGRLSVL
ncbi:pentatricopeptide repeat domain-containing protein [Colletotrichum limetticola]|uniref:Pentatricopeptide repeat domain-containing protein n=1 Tax=Colletotrichum limetticola TaxID=1209924 RepID=A0ABQ9Q4L7_9PEZI|nr:pentatricopeptide repeat domain-containing protein [Colletotrichum limetticola]